MLNAARVHGSPMIVIAMKIAAITQPTAIHRPPKRIHRRLSKKEKADMALVDQEAPALAGARSPSGTVGFVVRPPQCSNNAMVPRPPSAQMLTMARLPFGSAASSLRAWLSIRAPVAAKGSSATLPPFGFIRSRGKLPYAQRPPFRGQNFCPREL